MRQSDLFAAGRLEKQVSQGPDRDAIRERLNAVLRELRTAETFPWTPAQLRSWRHVFHNMANWLPETERDEIRQAFLAEISRWPRA